MIFGCRKFVSFVVITVLVIIDDRCRGQSNETSSNDYTDSEIDLVPTFRTGIERVLQGLSTAFSGGSSSSDSDERGRDFLSSLIPKPVKDILPSVKNITARSFGEVLNLFEDHFHAIFPGTLWCGAGNIADSEKDVGLFKRTDSCCRAHDNCPSNINAGKTLGRLVNNGIFTRSACICDHEFYDCLKNASTVIAANIGATYFNILRPQCFALDYPIESCAKYGRHRIIKKKCVKYNVDESRNKTLEWFDNPDF